MIRNEKKITKITGTAVFLFATIIYLLTVAPTTSFWDCGEFITTSYILGIPHPPGPPFYLMLGRIFSMIPFASDIGLRVNLISVFSSSFTVLFLYLISLRLIENWRGSAKDKYDLFINHGSSVIGALSFAFTYTFWFNAVEAEVYALSMFFTSIIIWLTLVWTEKYQENDSSKYLLLIMLLVGLGTGVHLLNILTLPVVIYIIWFYDRRMSFIVGAGVFISILVLFAFPLHWKIYSLFIFFILTVIFQRSENNQDVSLSFIMPLLLILGYSTYLMIYIRAGMNPPINENDPSNWQRMMAYLNREQYGDEEQLKNAVKLLFGEGNRKYLESVQKLGATPGGPGDPWKGHWAFFWQYQIVEMYIRYFNWQFIGHQFDNIKQIVSLNNLYAIPFFAGLWGAIHHFFKDWKKASAIGALFIIMSLGLVIYQNQDVLQPRERDYFYVGSFFIFAIWIGMGITSIAENLKENRKLKKLIIPLMIAGLIIPGLEFKTNYHYSDRTGNYVAWDYSKNILESCDENAILFTNGDNDTFPVWYLQEVEGIRKDVQVINLSLLNTGWYIRQLKKKLPKYFRYTEKQIKEYFDQHHMTSEGFMRRYWPETKTLKLPDKNGEQTVQWELGPTLSINVDGGVEGFLKVQDQMVLEIIAYNAQMGWEKPVYFAVTVGRSNFIGIDEYMRMDGLCFRVVDYKADKGIDPEVVYERVLNRYLGAYRNLDDPDIYYDDNILRLLQNYRSAFLQLAIHYDENEVDIDEDNKKDIDMSKNYSFEEFSKFTKKEKISYLLEKMEQIIPSTTIPYSNEMVVAELAGMYSDVGEREKGLKLLSLIDPSDFPLKKKLRFILYAVSRGYSDYGKKTINQITEEILRLPNDHRKYEKLFELYAGFIKMDDKEMTAAMGDKILKDLERNKNKELRNSTFKEFAVLAYQGGEKQYSAGILEKYLKIEPTDKEGLELLYQIYSIEEDLYNSLKTINRILELDPGDQEYTDLKKVIESKIDNRDQ